SRRRHTRFSRDWSSDMCSSDLFGGQFADELPDRLARLPGQQVPDGVDDGARRQMHRALVGTDPAQLAVAGQVTPVLARRLADLRSEARRAGQEGVVRATRGLET